MVNQRTKLENFESIAVILAAALAVGALIYAGEQFKHNKEQAREQTTQVRIQAKTGSAALESHMQEQMAGLDRYFAEHPHLRRHFYYSPGQRLVDVPLTQPRRAEVLATAELVIDLAATVASSRDLMDGEAVDRWYSLFNSYFCQSQSIRFKWHAWSGNYSSDTKMLLGAPSGDKWSWKTPAGAGCPRS
jgi:hypothetical protein